MLAGIWNLTDCLYLLDVFDPTNVGTNSLLNVKSSSFALTKNGSPTFTSNQGWVFATNQDLNTNFNASTAGGNYSQNSSSIFTWTPNSSFTGGTDYGATAGYKGTSVNVFVYPQFSDNNFYWSANGLGDHAAHVAANLFGFSRNGSIGSSTSGYQDTVATVGTQGSTALVNDNFVFGNRQSDANPFTLTLSMGLIAGAFTSDQVAVFYQLNKIRRFQITGGF